MAEHWIPAAKALEICKSSIALCTRAHAGLIMAKARLLVVDKQQNDEAKIPSGFWWAGGHAALEQDWAAGDFSTWIGKEYEVRAFGVTFALSGILEMVEFTQRPLIARSLSVAGKPEWMTAKEAIRVVAVADVCRPANCDSFILEQARLGFVAARAINVIILDKASRATEPFLEAREWDVPLWYWEKYAAPGQGVKNWDLGRFESEVARTHIALSGLHFHRDSIRAITGAAVPAKVTSQAAEKDASPPGRKRKYDWEEGGNAIWGAIYRGALIPDIQADIEKALQAHFRKDDDEPSESTIRPYASRIWSEYSKEAEN